MKNDMSKQDAVIKIDPAIQLLTQVHSHMDPNASDDDIEKSVQDSLALWQDMNSRLQQIMNVCQRLNDLWFNYSERSAFGLFDALDHELQQDMSKIVTLLYKLDTSMMDIERVPKITIEGYCKAIQNDYEKYGELMAQVINVEQKLKERYAYALESVAVRRPRAEVLKDISFANPKFQKLSALTELYEIFQLTKNNEFKPYAKYLFKLDPYQAIKLYALTLQHAKNEVALNKLIGQDTITTEEKEVFKKALVDILKNQTGHLIKKELWKNVPTDIKAWLTASPEEEAQFLKQVRIEEMKKELKKVVERLNPEERVALDSTLNEQLKKLYPDIAFEIQEEYAPHSPTNSRHK